jgi:hypothetical protein
MPGMTRICMVRTVLGQQYVSDKSIPYGGVLPYLQAKFAKPEDIFIVNFGVWHRKQGEEGFRQYDKALKDLIDFYQVRAKVGLANEFIREVPYMSAPSTLVV